MPQGTKMKILWIGHGTHRPSPEFPFSISDDLYWHYLFSGKSSLYDFLLESGDNVIGELHEFSLRDELFYRGAPVDLQSVDLALFTWNCLGLNEGEIKQWLKIESYLKEKKPSIAVMNSIEEFPIINFKSLFFDRLRDLGYSSYVPNYEEVNSVFSLLSTSLPYPLIVRSNLDTGGRNTYLCRNMLESLVRFRFIKQDLTAGRQNRLEDFRAPEIIKVRYYDNYYPDFNCHASFRIIFINRRLAFIYPHISVSDWCIHTDMEDHSPARESFLAACEFIYDFVRRKYDIFRDLVNSLNIHTLTIDFLVHDDKPIFLEVELKYGCDINFVKGPLRLYDLDLSYFRAKNKEIEDVPVSFDSFFNRKEVRNGF